MTNFSDLAVECHRRGCLERVVILFLAAGLMLSTGKILHYDSFACFGTLGAGFPVSSVCDYSGGGSPLSSAGRIDWADYPYFSLQGMLADLLFYSLLIGALWWITGRLTHRAGASRPTQGVTDSPSFLP